jgi:hypothetical protein
VLCMAYSTTVSNASDVVWWKLYLRRNYGTAHSHSAGVSGYRLWNTGCGIRIQTLCTSCRGQIAIDMTVGGLLITSWRYFNPEGAENFGAAGCAPYPLIPASCRHVLHVLLTVVRWYAACADQQRAVCESSNSWTCSD